MRSANAAVKETKSNQSTEFFALNREHGGWCLAAILLAHMPMMLLHLGNLWLRPQYRYFPIVLLVIGYLLWRRTEPLARPMNRPIRELQAYLVLASSLLVLVGSLVIFSPWLAAIAFVLAFGGVLLLFSELYFLQNLLGIWLLSCLLIPLPSIYGLRFLQWSDRITAEFSGNLLDRVGIVNLVDGTTVSLVGGDLLVDRACSGVLSIISIIAFAFVIAVWNNRSAIHTAVLMVSGVVWASTANILQIITLAISQEKLGIHLTSPWRHHLLQLSLFTIAALLILSSDRFFAWFFSPIRSRGRNFQLRHSRMKKTWNWLTKLPPSDARDHVARDHVARDHLGRNRQRRGRRRRKAAFLMVVWAGVYCLTGVVSVVLIVRDLARPDSPPSEFSTAPAVPFSQQSRRFWHDERCDLRAVFSIDFSSHDWHDRCPAYKSIGWEQRGNATVVNAKMPGGVRVYETLRRQTLREMCAMRTQITKPNATT